MKFYIIHTYVGIARLARVVQTRDARTVNPDENKPDAKNNQRIYWPVVLLTLHASNIWRIVDYTGKLIAWLRRYRRVPTIKKKLIINKLIINLISPQKYSF